MVVVKWSACLPSTPTIRVQILLKPTAISVKFVFEKNKNKLKEAGVGPFFKNNSNSIIVSNRYLVTLKTESCPDKTNR